MVLSVSRFTVCSFIVPIYHYSKVNRFSKFSEERGAYQNLSKFTTRHFQLTLDLCLLHEITERIVTLKTSDLTLSRRYAFFGIANEFYLVALGKLMRKIALGDSSEVISCRPAKCLIKH